MEDHKPYWLCKHNALTYADLESLAMGEAVNSDGPPVGLFRLKSGNFQVTSPGQFDAIMGNQLYTLVNTELAQLIQGFAPEQIQYRPVQISRRATQEIWEEYSEVRFARLLKYEDYESTSCNGIQLFYMPHNMIYVSPELKALLEPHVAAYGLTFKQELPFMVGE